QARANDFQKLARPHRSVRLIERNRALELRSTPATHRHEAPDDAGPRCSTHEASIPPRDTGDDGLTGLTSDGGLSGGVTSDVGGMPVARGRITGAIPEASV